VTFLMHQVFSPGRDTGRIIIGYFAVHAIGPAEPSLPNRRIRMVMAETGRAMTTNLIAFQG